MFGGNEIQKPRETCKIKRDVIILIHQEFAYQTKNNDDIIDVFRNHHLSSKNLNESSILYFIYTYVAIFLMYLRPPIMYTFKS